MKTPKKPLFASVLFLAAALSGCSSLETSLQNWMLQESGVALDSGYQAYQQYVEDGKLNPDGYYSGETSLSGDPADSVYVTFAENSFLEAEYYSDEAGTLPLNVENCRLAPGGSIYAKVSRRKEAVSSTYAFSCFRIYQVNAEGSRELISSVTPDGSGRILQIPSEYAGTELSIEPVGAYSPRRISLRDYWMDNGVERELSGKWMIDHQEYTGGEAEINPVSPYIISYEYDSGEYFYGSSHPECYYHNNEDGIVIFQKREAAEETEAYSVELHKYLTAFLPTGRDRTVRIDQGEAQTLPAGSEWELSKLKYGDLITIQTDKAWPELERCRDVILQSEETLSGGSCRYTLLVPQKGKEFFFDPAEYSYEHGTILFQCFGETATTPQKLPQGTRITYRQGTVEDGYWLPQGDHVIVVGEEEETKRQLQNIHFTPQVRASVELKQPAFGGSIRYYDGERELSSGVHELTSGTQLTMKFFPWEGWISRYQDGQVYTVTTDPSQTITMDGKEVDGAFTEDPGHKPTLEVILSKSVGTEMWFRISASGLEEKSYQYEDIWFWEKNTIIRNQKIGTERGISLSMGNRALQAGTAVKLLVEKVDSEGNRTSSTRLVTRPTQFQEPIPIYESGEPGTSPVWYKSLQITISVVKLGGEPENVWYPTGKGGTAE